MTICVVDLEEMLKMGEKTRKPKACRRCSLSEARHTHLNYGQSVQCQIQISLTIQQLTQRALFSAFEGEIIRIEP
jgi:hypothetical protein